MHQDSLCNASRSGVYHLAARQQTDVGKQAGLLGLTALHVDLHHAHTADAALRTLGDGLKLPDWYGANFDALADCLSDPEWLPAKGHVLMLDGLAGLRRAAPDDFATLVAVFEAIAETRREQGLPFWVLLDTPADGVPHFPKA